MILRVPKSALIIQIFVPKYSIKTLIKNQNHHFHLPCMIFPQLRTPIQYEYQTAPIPPNRSCSDYPARTCLPVSYTHLDVYTRQKRHRRRHSFPTRRSSDLGCDHRCKCCHRLRVVCHKGYSGSVSYTHLDVYKRQLLK